MAFLSHSRLGYGRTVHRRRLTLGDMMSLYRQRAALRRLDDHQLADLGLSRSEAEAEARRPLWDAPRHWMER